MIFVPKVPCHIWYIAWQGAYNALMSHQEHTRYLSFTKSWMIIKMTYVKLSLFQDTLSDFFWGWTFLLEEEDDQNTQRLARMVFFVSCNTLISVACMSIVAFNILRSSMSWLLSSMICSSCFIKRDSCCNSWRLSSALTFTMTSTAISSLSDSTLISSGWLGRFPILYIDKHCDFEVIWFVYGPLNFKK